MMMGLKRHALTRHLTAPLIARLSECGVDLLHNDCSVHSRTNLGRNQPAVEPVKLRTVLFGLFGHRRRPAQARKHRQYLLLRRRADQVLTALASAWRFCLSSGHNLEPTILNNKGRAIGYTNPCRKHDLSPSGCHELTIASSDNYIGQYVLRPIVM